MLLDVVLYMKLPTFLLGDEIFSINGQAVQGMTHQEAISLFKEVQRGELVLTIGRRNTALTQGTNTDGETNIERKSERKQILNFKQCTNN